MIYQYDFVKESIILKSNIQPAEVAMNAVIVGGVDIEVGGVEATSSSCEHIRRHGLKFIENAPPLDNNHNDYYYYYREVRSFFALIASTIRVFFLTRNCRTEETH